MENSEAKALLALDAPRSVTLRSKDHSYIFRLRRVSHADWHAFFTGIVHQTLQLNGNREQVFESESALLELVDRVLVSAEGYGELRERKHWKLAIPVRHRIAVGIALRSVSPALEEADAEPMLCDLAEVRLDATWSSSETEAGKMVLYAGLVHRFRQPSLADLKRWNFESARTRVSGTAENGVTIYPPRQAIAMKVYDELIESVDGYAVGGLPLDGADQIKREMDGAHKAAAALALFSQGEDAGIE